MTVTKKLVRKIYIITYCTSRDTRTYMISKTDMDTALQTKVHRATVLRAYDYCYEMVFIEIKPQNQPFIAPRPIFLDCLIMIAQNWGWNVKITAIFTVDTIIIGEMTHVLVSKIYWHNLSFNSKDKYYFISNKRSKSPVYVVNHSILSSINRYRSKADFVDQALWSDDRYSYETLKLETDIAILSLYKYTNDVNLRRT